MNRLRRPFVLVAMCATVTAAEAQEAGQVHIARAGEGLIPPRDYGHSDGPVDPARHDPNESGKIYDIAYAGIVQGGMQFEYRGYSITGLTTPASSQTEQRELNVRTVVIRDIVLTILEARADWLRYIWTYQKGGSDLELPAPDTDPGPAVQVKER